MGYAQNYSFLDRKHAGRDLAVALERYRDPSTLVLGLPRGGVVVAAEVARVLDAELDVIISRKVGAPSNPEYAIGAVAEGGQVYLNDAEIARAGIDPTYVTEEIQRQEEAIRARARLYRGGRPLPSLQDRPVIVVDDGIATGFTMFAALLDVRARGAHPVVMAVPVAPPPTLERLSYTCDDAAALATPQPFYAVGMFYQNFDQVSDDEVVALLRGQHRHQNAA